jgi:hypothetical protein
MPELSLIVGECPEVLGVFPAALAKSDANWMRMLCDARVDRSRYTVGVNATVDLANDCPKPKPRGNDL